jgi:PhnB protein
MKNGISHDRDQEAWLMTNFQPHGWPTVIPRMFTENVGGLIGFLKLVFCARGELRTGAPVEMRIGDSLIMVSDGGGVREPRSTFLYIYVENTDETYQRALDAGALTIERPADMSYGDRRATVQDPWGNIWQIATHGGAFA